MLMGMRCQSLLKKLPCPCISAFSCWHFVNFLFAWQMMLLKPHKNSSLKIASFRFAIKLHRALKGPTVRTPCLVSVLKHCYKTEREIEDLSENVCRLVGSILWGFSVFSSKFIRTACPLGPWVVDWLQILSVDKLSFSLNRVHGCINTHFIILRQWHNICLHQTAFWAFLCVSDVNMN